MCKTFYGPCNILRGLLRPNKHQEHNIYFEIEYPAWADEANLGARDMLYEFYKYGGLLLVESAY